MALDARIRQVVGRAVGDRDEFTAQCLGDAVPRRYRNRAVVATDRLPAYRAVVPPGQTEYPRWELGVFDDLIQGGNPLQEPTPYAFTRTHYFRLTARPDPKPHTLLAFPGRTSAEALETVVRSDRPIRGGK